MALLGALFIGFSLAILGSGGAIITIPVLVYGIGMPEKEAIMSSLIVVGILSLLSSLKNPFTKNINIRLLLAFGVPSVLCAYLGADAAVDAPVITQLIVLSFFMYIAGGKMLFSTRTPKIKQTPTTLFPIFIVGGFVGLLTGFVGVGGGFLIVPALILAAGLQFDEALATSLILITLNAIFGLTGYLTSSPDQFFSLRWTDLTQVILLGAIGVLFGGRLRTFFPQTYMTRLFGALLMIISTVFVFNQIL
ncbi:sulfite exporter TauE/SafE family protein [Grimontia sp. NTOU-MAR1]|uniref:sulfite exporter TauE/SafE family protein n=1 Tax=Grimontia sp. NTOU-MAR1 TaxID=3111011 RepID=UPI002DBAF14B|nr:sulfite exporter TauE/SafE family protein [Grimontia sp. NTOU-MAR1]WRV98024.1 sulfite exporter TauE/SafE family protein [Grimontia sp. NTOU-MAR1]